jgi:glycosyltransferase involved in cell wall biosynthesis
LIKVKKRVLIITYYWPPSGGIGVLRCLKIAKYLRDFGWEPVIFTAKNAHYPSIDHSNDKDIPPDIEIIKHPIWEPYKLYKIFTRQKKDANVMQVLQVKDKNLGLAHKVSVWIRSNFFIPDARAFWIKSSVKFLLKYLKENPVDAIFTDGPPHTNTRIATIIKNNTGIPWISDFQDPWTQVDYYKLLSLTDWADRKHKRFEQEAFKAADLITIASPTWKEDLEGIGAKNVRVIVWGYDPEDFSDPPPDLEEKFIITHLGTLGYDRTPRVFLSALKEMLDEIPSLKNDLEIRLIGQVDYSTVKSVEELSLNQWVKLIKPIPRKDAIRFTRKSTILLLLLNKQENAKGRIPGKIFEYLAASRPVIALGPTNSDVAKILEATGGGACFDYSDKEGIKAGLLELYSNYKNNNLKGASQQYVEQYSIRNLTKKIAGYLDDITKK